MFIFKFGKVISVIRTTDKLSGKKRGFCFVEFNDYDPVDKAILKVTNDVYNDVYNDIYNDVYNDVYNDIYNDVYNDVNKNFINDVYKDKYLKIKWTSTLGTK